MKLLLGLFAALVVSVCAGLLAGYAFMTRLPCRLFGSSFEGACEFGQLGYATWVGALVMAGCLVWLSYRVAKAQALREQAAASDTSLRLRTVWVVSSVLLLLGAPLMNMVTRPSLATAACGALLLALYMAMSLAMARVLKINRWIALGLPLFPGVGTLASILLIGKAAFFDSRAEPPPPDRKSITSER